MSNIFNGEGGQDRIWRESDEERHRRQSYREGGRERGFFDRATDEMRSWFGDEEAERRRRMDERRYGREGERYRGEYDPTGGRYYRSGYESQTGREGYGGQSPFERRRYGSESYGSPYRGGPGYSGEGYYSPYAESSSYTEIWMMPGPYTGQGPVSYKRSDERIREDICERLTQHGLVDASRIEVEVTQGEVTLRGSVNSRGAKRMAEETAESVSGVKDVQNQLRVNPEQSQAWEQGATEQSPEFGQQWQSDQPSQRPNRPTQ